MSKSGEIKSSLTAEPGLAASCRSGKTQLQAPQVDLTTKIWGAHPAEHGRPAVRCVCGQYVFDGVVIKSRVVRVLPIGAEAKCRCKRWVAVPVSYQSSHADDTGGNNAIDSA